MRSGCPRIGRLKVPPFINVAGKSDETRLDIYNMGWTNKIWGCDVREATRLGLGLTRGFT